MRRLKLERLKLKRLKMVIVLGSVLAAACASAQPPAPSAALGLPPTWEAGVLFYDSFDRPDGRPDIDRAAVGPRDAVSRVEAGVRGRCALVSKPLHLEGEALSPHRPLTIAFWWALRKDATRDTGFGLCSLGGTGGGYVANFTRSGPWCGLDRTAGVLQIYNLPRIQNVNAIYDREIAAHIGLRAGEWHHTALVLAAGSLVTVYTDGQEAARVRLVGRGFSASDSFRTLDLGGGEPILLDEVVVLNRPLGAEEIAEYVQATRQMRAAGYPIRL